MGIPLLLERPHKTPFQRSGFVAVHSNYFLKYMCPVRRRTLIAALHTWTHGSTTSRARTTACLLPPTTTPPTSCLLPPRTSCNAMSERCDSATPEQSCHPARACHPLSHPATLCDSAPTPTCGLHVLHACQSFRFQSLSEPTHGINRLG